MPDMTPPIYGWSDFWWDSGRTQQRVGLFGRLVLFKEQWRFPFADERQAPEFRWVRAKGGVNRGPTPKAVVRMIDQRAAFYR